MIDEALLLDFLDDEIHFFQESKGPLRYRLLCWLLRVKPPKQIVIKELEWVQTYIALLARSPDKDDPDAPDNWYVLDPNDPHVTRMNPEEQAEQDEWQDAGIQDLIL